jgi:hypothetical protein
MPNSIASGLQDHNPYQTPEELFSDPACKHIISMATDQQIHLERLPKGLRVTYPDGFILIKRGNPEKRWQMRKHHLEPRSEERNQIEQHFGLYTEVFSHLQDFYQQHHPSWKNISPQDAIWQDISDYPELPYSTIYCPIRESISFFARLEGVFTPHGPYVAYGPAEVIHQGARWGVLLRPTSNWLVLEYPAISHPVVYKIIHLHKRSGESQQPTKPDRSLGSPGLVERPACLVVYGRPPGNWRSGPQHLMPLPAT